jgi:DNA polymerase-3 subunit beta
MRFSCDQSRLAESAVLVSQAAASKSTKKIFECLRLKVDEEGLELAATEVIPAGLFAATLRSIGDETVSLRSLNRKLLLETDGGLFEFEGEDPVEFPEIPDFPGEATAKVPAEELRALVRKTSFATAREATRFTLNGVRILAKAHELTFVATDGRRLAAVSRSLGEGGGPPDDEGRSAIVGVKGVQQFEKAAAEVDGALDLALGDRFVALGTLQTQVTVRVLDGVFPDHREVIPEQCERTAGVPVDRFAARLKQAAQFASAETQSVILHFKPGEILISAAGGEGRAEVRLGVEYDGPEERLGFNPSYLIDGLKVMDAETIEFGFNGSSAAARLKDGTGFVYVVMPVIID